MQWLRDACTHFVEAVKDTGQLQENLILYMGSDNQTMTELVARRIITPSMGSSLINDSVFAHDVAMNLVQAAQVLFVTVERHMTQAACAVVLDKSDLTRIGTQADVESQGR